MLPGWDVSVGVKAEIELARQLGKPMRFVDPVSMTTENTPVVPGCREG